MNEPNQPVTPSVAPFVFGARCLFIGPAFGLSPHRNAVAVLALGLDSTFRLTENARETSIEWRYRTCRSALIPPNTLHHLTDTSGLMAFLYVDALSLDYARLRSLATTRGKHADFDLSCESQLINWCHRLSKDPSTAWRDIRPQMEQLLCGDTTRIADQRIVSATALIRAHPEERFSLEALAKHAGLSTSRFIHLFKETTGVPLRRYRLWAAMNAAMRSMIRGANLSRACLDAGFASSAHFSATYREMFGMEPSRFLATVSQRAKKREAVR